MPKNLTTLIIVVLNGL